MTRLVAVGTVRNEEDIIESFVRHTLHFVDELRLIDHLSTDRTPAILAALLAAWATFLPSFVFIFLGAPHLERVTREADTITAVLSLVVSADREPSWPHAAASSPRIGSGRSAISNGLYRLPDEGSA